MNKVEAVTQCIYVYKLSHSSTELKSTVIMFGRLKIIPYTVKTRYNEPPYYETPFIAKL